MKAVSSDQDKDHKEKKSKKEKKKKSKKKSKKHKREKSSSSGSDADSADERSAPVRLSDWKDGDQDAPRSMITGELIKRDRKLSKEDRKMEKQRLKKLAAMNGQYMEIEKKSAKDLKDLVGALEKALVDEKRAVHTKLERLQEKLDEQRVMRLKAEQALHEEKKRFFPRLSNF